MFYLIIINGDLGERVEETCHDDNVNGYSFDPVSKNHDETWFSHHVVADHDVIAGQHDHCLFSRYSLAVVSVVMSPVVLTRFQR